MLPENFISDLEKAIASRSADTGTMLHQITDLFISNASNYSTEQLDVSYISSSQNYPNRRRHDRLHGQGYIDQGCPA
jgi:hypothetical protein